MTSFELVPRKWYTGSQFNFVENGAAVAGIDCSWVGEKAKINAAGVSYTASREHMMSGAFFIEANGQRLATADKPSALHRLFEVTAGGKTYTLKAAALLGRAFVLLEGDREVGRIAPKGLFSRKAQIELPKELSLPAKAFITWLVVVMWKRQSKAAESSRPGS